MAGFGITKVPSWGRAVLKKFKKDKKLRSSGTDTIKFKPGVGGLKASRDMFENLQKSSAIGVEKFGRPHTTKLISEQGVKKGFPGLTKQAGDITRLKKATEKKFKVKLDDLKIPPGKK